MLCLTAVPIAENLPIVPYSKVSDKARFFRSFTLFLTVAAALLGASPARAEKAKAAAAASSCADKPEVRFYIWAWNAQMGMILSNGGKQAAAASSMCKHGVNLKLIREDNTDQMQALMATFAEGLKKGQAQPANGAHFVAIM